MGDGTETLLDIYRIKADDSTEYLCNCLIKEDRSNLLEVVSILDEIPSWLTPALAVTQSYKQNGGQVLVVSLAQHGGPPLPVYKLVEDTELRFMGEF